MSGPVLAIDIGGTKLAAALVSVEGVVLRSDRAPTPDDSVWPALTALVDSLQPRHVVGVGVGCGGPMSWPAGVVSPLNIPAWRGFPLRARLRGLFPGVPVRVHNDAVCVAVAEHWRGAGQGLANVLGMVVSTGVGGGLVLGGRLLDGASGNAGHIGHVVVEPAGPRCTCGGHGCLEAVARGPALVAWARAQGWSGGTTGTELAAAAADGDQLAVAAFERAGRAVGVAIASAAALCDLELVTVGGGLAQAGELLLAPLRAVVAEHARLDFLTGLRVVPSSFGPDAGLVGAAALVLSGERYWSAD